MVGSCPAYNTDKNLESLCTAKSSNANLFGMLPVSDLTNNTVYKNVFCASCNQATNLTYWKFSATCEGISSHEIPKNRSLKLAFIIKECEWYFQSPSAKSDYLKFCLAIEQTCPDSELVDEEPVLRDLCSFYVFPACANTKNLHCRICNGQVSEYSCKCNSPWPEAPVTSGPGAPGMSGPGAPGIPGPGAPAIPPLSILFEFSLSSHSVHVGDKKTVVRNKECADGFVFDPFNENCVQIHASMSTPEMALRNISGSEDNTNCSYVTMNISSVSLLSNGSIWIPLHKRIYNKERYLINGSSVFLCSDFKRDYIKTETLVSVKITLIQIFTYIGCGASMISLISLLGIYIALPELRTLPGKNLMSLSCAMLLYHVFFLLTGQTDTPNLCLVVSVLLHYFLLSSFFWMGVMALDVARTFGGKGTNLLK